MTIRSPLAGTLCVAALALAPMLARAGFFQWEMVETTANGASCGNGTPYRFFVNRTPLNKDLTLVYEGGGACWDQRACLGEGKLGATNPNGVPADYMQSINVAYGLVTPFSARNDPFQAVQTQSWNMVFLPYCTGDVHSGSKVTVYDDACPATPRVQHHAGQANIRAAAQWLRDNLGRPDKLMLTGYSAGGVGSTVTYGLVRDALEPRGASTLLADSGPVFPAPRSSTPDAHPSLLLHNTIRAVWGLDEPGGLVASYGATLPGFDPDDFGSVNRALSMRYPDDRFGFMVFQADLNFSAFSYEKFYPDIPGAPTPRDYRDAIYSRWEPDIARWTAELSGLPNVMYHVPYLRAFNDSHCLTIIDFSGTGIQELAIDSLASFVDAALDRGPLMRNTEVDRVADLTQPLSGAIRLFKLISWIIG